MKAAPFLLLLLPALALAAGTTTDQITMKPQASPTCTSGRACIYAKSGTDRVYVTDSAGLELQSNAARSFRTSADCTALSAPANGDVCYSSGLGAFQFYAAGWSSGPVNDSLLVHKAGSETITGAKNFSNQKLAAVGTPTVSTDAANKAYVDAAAPEIWFTRTCTLTSAAAATPVNCLLDAAVTGSKSAYLMGWHIKVNGATPWATTANCYIADTSGAGGTGLLFVTAAVAALTANAYVSDHSTNITQGDAYALSSGSTAAKGLQIACNANGTGSNLVVTVFGTIK